MTVTENRAYAPYFEHGPARDENGNLDYTKVAICGECVQNLWTIDQLATDLKDMANWPGSGDGHYDISLLLRSFTSMVGIAKQDDTPEVIARDLGDFLEVRQNMTS